MEIKSANFDNEVLRSDIPVLVEFWGSWCPPCKVMEPILDRLETVFYGKTKICKVNTDLNPRLRKKYGIRGLPTFLVFVNGKETERYLAAKSEDALREIISKSL